jgi:tRNA(Ile)-lysidine synthase
VVCVSGGVDSVALLHILAELRDEWKLDLHVLHFNHGTRAESEEEESFVRGLGEQLGVAVHVRHPKQPFEAASFQAKARAWRRAEAQKLVDEVGAQVGLYKLNPVYP